uniref:Uncharacterized protein n=1 Tax=Romanomermis culicivorax TaxID=13658 RepID=A0A915JQK4_ROMCU
EKFERADRLYADSVLYVNVPNLSPREAYSVEGDLLLDVASAAPNNKAPFDWSNPVVVGNYFGSAPVEYVIGACSRPF